MVRSKYIPFYCYITILHSGNDKSSTLIINFYGNSSFAKQISKKRIIFTLNKNLCVFKTARTVGWEKTTTTTKSRFVQYPIRFKCCNCQLVGVGKKKKKINRVEIHRQNRKWLRNQREMELNISWYLMKLSRAFRMWSMTMLYCIKAWNERMKKKSHTHTHTHKCQTMHLSDSAWVCVRVSVCDWLDWLRLYTCLRFPRWFSIETLDE